MDGVRGIRALVCALALLVLAVPVDAGAATYAETDRTDGQIVLGNELVERSWHRNSFSNASFVDKRSGREWAGLGQAFELSIAGAELASNDFNVTEATAEAIDGGTRLVLKLAPIADETAAGLEITRTIEVYEGIAGFRTETTLRSASPLALQGYWLDQLSLNDPEQIAPTAQAFRAGADWREADWEPALTVGEKGSVGDWREESSAAAGNGLSVHGEWLSLQSGAESLFVVLHRNDLPSSRVSYGGALMGGASVGVDFSRDIVSAGPFEEQIHAQNFAEVQNGRPRLLEPGVTYRLESTFAGVARDQADEAWQWHRYLADTQMPPWRRDVTFNSNGVDGDAISTGAKDDMNMANVRAIAPKARDLGVETFILDDGWQARSGDWCPDWQGCPEPRAATNPAKFGPRFEDGTFAAVRQEIAPMNLGLWMNPTFFHPSAQAWKDHPEWICQPIGTGLTAYNTADQTSGSNEAGLSAWGPDALPYIESKIRTMVGDPANGGWGVKYFKFDFLVWLDCLGQGDLYQYHDEFVAMVDRILEDHPDVTIQIDETNDYRMFPFVSTERGPSWFLNGGPSVQDKLHTIWKLSPYVPAFTLGFGAITGGTTVDNVDTNMASALLSHITFFNDLRHTAPAIIDKANDWTAFYKQHRAAFTGVTYPLLADPNSGGWTALQNWSPDEGIGSLLAFRQGDSAASKTIALENVPAGKTYELIEAPSGASAGTVTSQQLRDGITVSADQNRAKVLLIKEVTP